MTKLQKLRLIEFLVIGIVMGLGEDILAVMIATDAEITPKVILIVLAVAVPFAFISEIVVDHPRFWQKVLPFIKDKESNLKNKGLLN